jgi:hypothetical protein
MRDMYLLVRENASDKQGTARSRMPDIHAVPLPDAVERCGESAISRAARVNLTQQQVDGPSIGSPKPVSPA